MHVQRIILASGLLIFAGCQTIGGESMPTLTRTGEVKDVTISESVEPTSVTVNPGDEVRWINKRRGTVQVIFLKPMTENLACQRNFGGPMGFGTKRNEYTARIGPNKTASVCFREPGELDYVAVPGFAPPEPEILLAASDADPSANTLPVEYTESLLEWFDERIRFGGSR